jgi:catechol 2,3-dioxygenase-like lactoylglutathione lyase family enzyme
VKPSICGVHHVKIPVTNLTSSRAFYEQLFDLDVLMEFPDSDGVPRGVAYRPLGGVSLALREDPDRAAALAGYDVIAFAVVDVVAVDAWVSYLDSRGIRNSGRVQGSVGPVVGFDDPDHIQIVLYGRG